MVHIRANIKSFEYAPGTQVLSDISLSVDKEETIAVLGVSGCGKSTLLRILAGILPSSEKHRFQGSVALSGQPPRQYREQGKLAFMFQDSTLFPNRTVRQNLTLPLELMGRKNTRLVSEMLDLVGLTDYAGYLPRKLSGGMRTRVAMARSFVTEPELLFLDEPFAGLDLGWKRDLYVRLNDLKSRFGCTIVMVTHDLQEAVFNANRIIVLAQNGTPLDTMEIDLPLPRPFDFSDTVSELTDQLDRLAHMIMHDAIRKETSEVDAWAVLDENERIVRERSPAASAEDIDLTAIRQHSNDAAVNERLVEMWEVALPPHRYKIIWDMLSYYGLRKDLHREAAEFILSKLDEFNDATIDYYGGGRAQLLSVVESKISSVEVIPSKRWIYLCHLPAVPEKERARQILDNVANQLDDRFEYPQASEVAKNVLRHISNGQETRISDN